MQKVFLKNASSMKYSLPVRIDGVIHLRQNVDR